MKESTIADSQFRSGYNYAAGRLLREDPVVTAELVSHCADAITCENYTMFEIGITCAVEAYARKVEGETPTFMLSPFKLGEEGCDTLVEVLHEVETNRGRKLGYNATPLDPAKKLYS